MRRFRTMLADPERVAYRAYGLRRGGVREVAGPRTWLPALRAMARAGTGVPVGDVWQMPGTFLIDRRGTIRFAHYPTDQSERPTVDELLAVLGSPGSSAER